MRKRTRQTEGNDNFQDNWRAKLGGIATAALDQSHDVPSSPILGESPLSATVDNVSSRVSLRKFVVGIDYGTTFTSVAYWVGCEEDDPHLARAADIKTIRNWPDDPNGNGMSEQVPTESWYPALPINRPTVHDQYDNPSFGEDQRVPKSEPSPKRQFLGLEANKGVDDTMIEEKNLFLDKCDESEADDDSSTNFLWGYQVYYQKYFGNSTRNPIRRVERAKLMLVNNTYTDSDRESLRRTLKHLTSKRLIRKYGKKGRPDIRDVRDVITDFLVKVFQHTKSQLIEHEGYTEECEIEFVMSVPTIWSQEASRVLQSSVAAAIQGARFGTLKNGGVDGLFLIPEPEAAATWMLEISREVLAGASVAVLDCGGGTVDVVSYALKDDYPARLGREIIPPEGDNCGSSYLNVNCEELLLYRLKDEHYLDCDGQTRETIVNNMMHAFETIDKRKKDITKNPRHKIRIPGLIGDMTRGLTGEDANRFDDHWLHLHLQDYERIFGPLLMRIGALVCSQIEGALAKGKLITTILLVGGFAGSPSLCSYLHNHLHRISVELGMPGQIKLVEDKKKCVTAVVSGAVLRALNKNNGPLRHAQSSYGFLQWEPYEPEVFPAHKHIKCRKDTDEDEYYVEVINYFMIKDEQVPAIYEYPPLKIHHTFAVDGRDLLCEELLYVSDIATESHMSSDRGKNKSAQLAGTIIVDLTHLREEGKILPTQLRDKDGDPKGELHYRVELDLVVMVEGRNLRYEARWPSSHLCEVSETQQVSIAAAFKPGTE